MNAEPTENKLHFENTLYFENTINTDSTVQSEIIDLDLDLDSQTLLFPGMSEPVLTESSEQSGISEPSELSEQSGDSEDLARQDASGKSSISDALISSVRSRGIVDLPFIASAAGVSVPEVIEELRGAIFCNPDKWEEHTELGWETAEEYLSGNLRHKLIKARIAFKTYGRTFGDNIKALEKILPHRIGAKGIYVTLGSPWLPTDIIDDFINHLISPGYYDVCKDTVHDEETGSWEIPEKGRYYRYVRNTSTYGTKRIDAVHIIENTLNMKTIKITDEVKSDITKSGLKRVINQEETAAALEKQRLIIAEFRRWIWKDKKRADRVIRIYEDKFIYNLARHFNGSFLDFPGMSKSVTLRPYQKDGVARIIFTPNTLLAHDVGAGKTYIMIAAAMELRRLGIADKIMFNVPNNIVDQWYELFMKLYPEANVLCVKPADFTPDRKNRTLRRIRDEKFDGIIIAYSCFDSIPLSKSSYIEELKNERDWLLKLRKKKKNVTGKFKRKIDSLDKKLIDAHKDMASTDGLICFDELGIDRLFVDEAHNYKNVSIDTTVTGVYGISSTGSDKCNKMMRKVRFIQSRHNGAGVVMATGTPITNSITDIFVFQKYLQSGELEMLGLQTFQSWVAMFAEKTTEFEIAVDTNSYRLTTRFSRFHNIPELTAILASIADFHMLDDSEGLPEFKGYIDVKIPRSDALKAYLEEISRRADRVHEHKVKRTEDNMLKITSDGRKAALDRRIVLESMDIRERGKWYDTYISEGRCKISECAERVTLLYYKTAEKKLVQLVFCDISTPKAGFNAYDELRRLMISFGVKSEEIAFIHDATTDARREKLFERVRKGEVRILIGSTFKLGLGVNIQDKLIAIHHLDVPWRPADMVQREGRILRSGNTNPEVFIYRYITEGSFDAYSWQLLETKQRFISDLLSGTGSARTRGEVDDTVLNYAEVKALALGNPLLKSRVETKNELSRLTALRRKSLENRIRLEQRLEELPDLIDEKELELKACISDVEYVEKNGKDVYKGMSMASKSYASKFRRYVREIITREIEDGSMRLQDHNLIEYRGFWIVSPAGMDPEHPYLYLVREGKYRVDMGDKALGALVRVDNYIEKLHKRVAIIERELELLRKELKETEVELANSDDYADRIEQVSAKLDRLDDELGVNELKDQLNS